MSIAHFRTDFGKPEWRHYPGLGKVRIDRSHEPDGAMLYRGAILWDEAPVGQPYPQTIEHTADCPYARAKALVGPASEREEER